MSNVITWTFSQGAALLTMITNNWYLGTLVGMFVTSGILTLTFSLFKRKK